MRKSTKKRFTSRSTEKPMENTYHAGKELHGNMRHMDARRIESLIDHMQYGHALIAYHKQDGTFRLAKATLLPTRQTSEEIMTSQE